MPQHQPHHLTHPRTQRIQAKAEQDTPALTHPEPVRLSLAVQHVNRILNEQSHRPDAIRLLREILRERAIRHQIKNWDANSLFG